MLNALAALYVKEQIVVLPSYNNRQVTEFESKTGGRMVGITLEGMYRIVSLVDGSELLSGPFYGEGMDSGDKATNKAMSIAYKYFAIQTYAIPLVGNDDPDFESSEPKPKASKPVAPKQQSVAPKQQPAPVAPAASTDETVQHAINRLISTKEQRKKLATLICGAYGVVVVDQLPDEKRTEAIQRLETYVAKAAAAG